MNAVYIFIDGQYLSLISKYFGNGIPLKIDLYTLSLLLARNEELLCEKLFYYTAPPFQGSPPTTDEALRKANYDKFAAHLKKNPLIELREGRCQKIDGIFLQKGVDTLLTMDLMNCANSSIKQIILIACDTDFVPILNELRKKGIYITLYYFNDYRRKSRFSMSNHLLTTCDKHVLITHNLLRQSMSD